MGTVSIRNRKGWPMSFELTMECVTPSLPAVTVTVRKPVTDLKGREGTAPIARVCPPTITLSGKGVLTGLPEQVQTVPAIRAAAAKGWIAIKPEAEQVEVAAESPPAPEETPAADDGDAPEGDIEPPQPEARPARRRSSGTK